MSGIIGAGIVGIVNRDEWQVRGACRGHKKPDLWYPDKRSTPAQIREAQEVCVDCTVRVACLQYAMDHPEEPGIWGGLTERQRAGLRSGRPDKAFAECNECSKEFIKRGGWHRYCSHECRKANENRRDREYAAKQRDRMRSRRAKDGVA